jgi:hypothetical protein
LKEGKASPRCFHGVYSLSEQFRPKRHLPWLAQVFVPSRGQSKSIGISGRERRQTAVLVKNSQKNSSSLLAFDLNCVLNITYAAKITQTAQRLMSEMSQKRCEVPRRILAGSRIEGVRSFWGCQLSRGSAGTLPSSGSSTALFGRRPAHCSDFGLEVFRTVAQAI